MRCHTYAGAGGAIWVPSLAAGLAREPGLDARADARPSDSLSLRRHQVYPSTLNTLLVSYSVWVPASFALPSLNRAAVISGESAQAGRDGADARRGLRFARFAYEQSKLRVV